MDGSASGSKRSSRIGDTGYDAEFMVKWEKRLINVMNFGEMTGWGVELG